MAFGPPTPPGPLGPPTPMQGPPGAPPDMPTMSAIPAGGAGAGAPPGVAGALPKLVFGIDQGLQSLARILPSQSEQLAAISASLRAVLAAALQGGGAQPPSDMMGGQGPGAAPSGPPGAGGDVPPGM